MANLPYWFTSEDRTNPVFCRACKQHIPRAAYMAGQGLCQSCLSRMGRPAPSPPGAMPSLASVPAPVSSGSPRVSSSSGPSLTPFQPELPKGVAPKRPVTGITLSAAILLAGAAIAVVRIVLHV